MSHRTVRHAAVVFVSAGLILGLSLATQAPSSEQQAPSQSVLACCYVW
ncbi:MAG: hypothetical protein P8Z68_01580 [Kineosporiaceae bacterium]|jgi:hypothetical protein